MARSDYYKLVRLIFGAALVAMAVFVIIRTVKSSGGVFSLEDSSTRTFLSLQTVLGILADLVYLLIGVGMLLQWQQAWRGFIIVCCVQILVSVLIVTPVVYSLQILFLIIFITVTQFHLIWIQAWGVPAIILNGFLFAWGFWALTRPEAKAEWGIT